MKIVSAFRRAVYVYYFFPIVGRVVDRCLRWVHSQDGWQEMVSAVTHASLETTSPVKLHIGIAEVIQNIGTYLGSDSHEVLQHIDEIAQKHSPEVN